MCSMAIGDGEGCEIALTRGDGQHISVRAGNVRTEGAHCKVALAIGELLGVE